VGPGFNFPTANSVADDFSLPQLTNALGQGIGGLVIAVNLTGPNWGPNNAPTTCTIDTALSRQVVTHRLPRRFQYLDQLLAGESLA
jgi:hypothetical protein